jgi:hypothetical protein
MSLVYMVRPADRRAIRMTLAAADRRVGEAADDRRPAWLTVSRRIGYVDALGERSRGAFPEADHGDKRR